MDVVVPHKRGPQDDAVQLLHPRAVVDAAVRLLLNQVVVRVPVDDVLLVELQAQDREAGEEVLQLVAPVSGLVLVARFEPVVVAAVRFFLAAKFFEFVHNAVPECRPEVDVGGAGVQEGLGGAGDQGVELVLDGLVVDLVRVPSCRRS